MSPAQRVRDETKELFIKEHTSLDEGYYWVRLYDEWTIGHHNGNNEWTACGTDEAFKTSDWQAVGSQVAGANSSPAELCQAAPDLLAALIRLREWVRHPGQDDSPENESVIDQAEAAIAKATERTP